MAPRGSEGEGSADGNHDIEREMLRENNNDDIVTENNIGNMSTQKIAGAMLARAYLPEPTDIKKAMAYADVGIKIQIILFELSSSLFWGSLGELLLFVFGFLLFFRRAVFF